eukprot:COSAG01_NODE_19890_length_983_cov_1.679864_1_plen_90_part_00
MDGAHRLLPRGRLRARLRRLQGLPDHPRLVCLLLLQPRHDPRLRRRRGRPRRRALSQTDVNDAPRPDHRRGTRYEVRVEIMGLIILRTD